jgi:hypothetical protein
MLVFHLNEFQLTMSLFFLMIGSILVVRDYLAAFELPPVKRALFGSTVFNGDVVTFFRGFLLRTRLRWAEIVRCA